MRFTDHYYYDGVRRIQEVRTIGGDPSRLAGGLGESVVDDQTTVINSQYIYGPDYVDELIAEVPRESGYPERGRHWIYLVMEKVIAGIDAGDRACVRLGIEFIEEDGKFPFGKILKSNTARALRRASLSNEQKQRICRRVFGLLRAGHVPHEFREYAKLVRKIGIDASEVPDVDALNPYAARFRSYFEAVARRNKL